MTKRDLKPKVVWPGIWAFAVSTLCGMAAASPILDATSKSISFQALLTDDEGLALPGPTVDLEFNIYNAGGLQMVAPIFMDDVPIAGGVVDVQIPLDVTAFDGTARYLGVTVNPPAAELSPRILLTATPYALRVDRVENAELTDNVELGSGADSGSLKLFPGGSAFETITMNGSSGQLTLWDPLSAGIRALMLPQGSGGKLILYDGTGSPTLSLDAQNDGTVTVIGGQIVAQSSGGTTRSKLSGSALETYNTTGDLRLRMGTYCPGLCSPTLSSRAIGEFYNIAGTSTVYIDAEGTGSGGWVSLMDGAGVKTVEILAAEALGDGGQIELFDADGSRTIQLDGDTGAGGYVDIRNGADTVMIALNGGSGGGIINLRDGTNDTIDLYGNAAGGGGAMTLRNSAGDATVLLDSDESDDAASFQLFDGINASPTMDIEAREGAAGGASIHMRNNSGVETLELDAHETDGAAAIRLHKADGTTTITLDPDVGGDGRITTQVLEITGGADLSERFDVSPCGTGFQPVNPQPGMVVSIDPVRPGQLTVSSKAYDRTVAGILSGAGGVQPGMLMGQTDSPANGKHAVALTGRVYCWCDASTAPIEAGDLLTTSGTPGHAMKVTDVSGAFGSILGKALTPLDEGKGLVLVLVSLQ